METLKGLLHRMMDEPTRTDARGHAFAIPEREHI